MWPFFIVIYLAGAFMFLDHFRMKRLHYSFGRRIEDAPADPAEAEHQAMLKELDRIHSDSIQVWGQAFEEATGKWPYWGTAQLGPEIHKPHIVEGAFSLINAPGLMLAMQQARPLNNDELQQLAAMQQQQSPYRGLLGGLSGVGAGGIGDMLKGLGGIIGQDPNRH